MDSMRVVVILLDLLAVEIRCDDEREAKHQHHEREERKEDNKPTVAGCG